MVEASEAIRRIIWRHWWLLLVLMIVPAAAVVARQESHPVTYAATANVQGQGITPDTTTQVSAIQSRVTAVATDPAVVQQAISTAGVTADATHVARHEVSVTPLGSSAVMALTVTDRSQPAAIRLAGALAGVVVNQINELGIKENPQLAALNQTIIKLTDKRNKLVTELDAVVASGAPSTSVQAQSLLALLSATEQELATAESTSQQILTTLTANTGASVVSTPSFATQASRHAVAYGALAALLGLVIGLLFGALREIVRPTVAEPAAGARELGTIPLGDAELSGDRVTRVADDLTGRLGLAAQRVGAGTVVLTGPLSRARLAALASRLNSELAAATPGRPADPDGWLRTPVLVPASGPGSSGDTVSHSPGSRSPVSHGMVSHGTVSHGAMSYSATAAQNGGQVYPCDLANDGSAGVHADHPAGVHGVSGMLGTYDGWPPTVVALQDVRLADQHPEAALVVALPRFAPHSSLDQAADLSLATDWPILGVIGLRRRGRYVAWAASRTAQNAESGVGGESGDTMEMERPDD